mgnify:FL=1
MTKMYFYIDRKNRINQVGNRSVLESNNIDLFDIVNQYNLPGDFPITQDNLLNMDNQELVNYILSMQGTQHAKAIKQSIVTECYLVSIGELD